MNAHHEEDKKKTKNIRRTARMSRHTRMYKRVRRDSKVFVERRWQAHTHTHTGTHREIEKPTNLAHTRTHTQRFFDAGP
jgi:hypothetical protein